MMLDRSGTFDGTTDADGVLVIQHGGGTPPRMWGCGPVGEGMRPVAANSNSRDLTLRIIEADSDDRVTDRPISGTWWARF